MKKTASTLCAIALLVACIASAAPMARPLTFVGLQVISNPAASTALSVPAEADFAIMTIRTAGVHINFLNVAATTSDQYFPAGVYTWDNQRSAVAKMRVINSSDGAAIVGVSYWKGN